MLLWGKLWSNEEPSCGANRAPGAPLGLPKSRPRGVKVRENLKRWPKCIARAILGGPGASPRGTSGDFWLPFRVPRSRRWGLWALFCRPIGCSELTFSHYCCEAVSSWFDHQFLSVFNVECGIDFHVFHCRWRLLFEHDFDTFFPFFADCLLYWKNFGEMRST